MPVVTSQDGSGCGHLLPMQWFPSPAWWYSPSLSRYWCDNAKFPAGHSGGSTAAFDADSILDCAAQRLAVSLLGRGFCGLLWNDFGCLRVVRANDVRGSAEAFVMCVVCLSRQTAILGGVLLWVGRDSNHVAGRQPVQIVIPAAILGGVLTCGLWCMLMVWTDRCYLPRLLQMGCFLSVLNLSSSLFLTSWGIRGIYTFFVVELLPAA